MQIHYCNKCGQKISDDDLLSGDAIQSAADQVFCKKCFPSGSAGKAPSVLTRPSTPTIRRPAPKTHSPAVQTSKNSAWLPMAIISALAVIALVAVLPFAFGKKGQDAQRVLESNPAPASASPVADNPAKQPVENLPPDPRNKENQASDALDAALSAPPEKRLAALDSFLKLYGDSSVAGRAREVIRKQKLIEEAKSITSVNVSAFENWTFYDGQEFKGATGGFAQDNSVVQKPGVPSIRLWGDFTNGGQYVDVETRFSTKVAELLSKIDYKTVKSLRFWVKSNDIKGLSIRIGDSTGQTHQQSSEAFKSGEWQQIEFRTFDSGGNYSEWGGANDKKFHWPPTYLAILIGLGGCNGTKKGTIWISQVEFVRN